MKKLFILSITVVVLLLLSLPVHVHAQMMGSPSPSIDQTTIQQQQAEEQEGKKLLEQIKNNATICQRLTNDQFEKIGEYFMGQATGDTSRHIAMNNMMKSMMGENGEEQMHISWGKRGSGCDNATAANSPQGGGNSMMGYGMMNWMMGGMFGFGLLGLVTWLLVIAVLILLVIVLGKQIQKK